MKFTTIILAAGRGTRMKSELPKVMHPVCGRAMINFPIIAARGAGAEQIIVVTGHGGALVRDELNKCGLSFAEQTEQLGTGHAVMVAEGAVKDKSLPVIILCGDVPLTRTSTISSLVERHLSEENSVTVLTAKVDEPSGYGRIIKDGDEILKIVEEKDASPEEKRIQEINSGIYCVGGEFLFEALSRVGKENQQGEYYLTDIIEIARASAKRAGWMEVPDNSEILGVNSRRELAEANCLMRKRILEKLMEEGVNVYDPGSTYIDYGVKIGNDSVIYPQVRIEGETSVGRNSVIETGSIIKNSAIAEGVQIRPYCVIDDSTVEAGSAIGPFAHLRPKSIIRKGAKVGNFVETKKSTIGEGSKVNHLSYIGDSHIGGNVNIGAGTITCNYDGTNKFQTIIEDGAFIGSGTNLVAPVTVGEGSVIGAGSTITKDVPPGSLALTRPEQKSIAGWAKKQGAEKKE